MPTPRCRGRSNKRINCSFVLPLAGFGVTDGLATLPSFICLSMDFTVEDIVAAAAARCLMVRATAATPSCVEGLLPGVLAKLTTRISSGADVALSSTSDVFGSSTGSRPAARRDKRVGCAGALALGGVVEPFGCAGALALGGGGEPCFRATLVQGP